MKKITFKKLVAATLASSFLFLSIVACEKEGTAEKAGKEMDKAFSSAKDKVNELTK